ncbi:hypothetical protein [Streptomyces sp. NPDC018833]|uniref:hypothetical protein n=1 Tax=Streptomyces sp. NPDC018833 TaxID=3365053 RepID=UPI0037AC6F29
MMVFDGIRARQGFTDWLRAARDPLVTDGPDDLGCRREQALSLLGLDDDGLGAFEKAQRVVVSLPHASPNIFFPRVGVSWYVRHLQGADESAFHLRVVLTHVNFSDLGWRPYAWWFLDEDAKLTRETLFTRNKKSKHVVVASRGPMRTVPERAVLADRDAAELARHGADRAASYMLLMAAVERSAGLGVKGRTLYVPLDLVVAYFRESYLRSSQGSEEGVEARWLKALLDARVGARRLAGTGRLEHTESVSEAFVFDNSSNIALLSLLSCSEVVGGAKMAGYWDEIGERIAEANRTSRAQIAGPRLARLPDVTPYERLIPPSPQLARALEKAGIPYSQGMAASEHGCFAEDLDPFA